MNIIIICLLFFVFLQGCNQKQASSMSESTKEDVFKKILMQIHSKKRMSQSL